MRLIAVGLITSANAGEGKDVGYVRFTDIVNGAALSLRAPVPDTNRLKPFVGQTVEFQAEFTVNQFNSKEGGVQLSLEMLSLVSVKPVKVVIQEAAPAQKAG